EDRRHDLERPVLAPRELFIEPAELEEALGRFATVTLDAFKVDTDLGGANAGLRNFPSAAPRELRLDMRADQPLAPLDAFVREFHGRVLIAADSPGRREMLGEMLRAHGHEVASLSGCEAITAGAARLARPGSAA